MCGPRLPMPLWIPPPWALPRAVTLPSGVPSSGAASVPDPSTSPVPPEPVPDPPPGPPQASPSVRSLPLLPRPHTRGPRRRVPASRGCPELRRVLEICAQHFDTSAVAVFIDFAKAFDSVDPLNMTRVLNAYRIPPYLIRSVFTLAGSDSSEWGFRLRRRSGSRRPELVITAMVYADDIVLLAPSYAGRRDSGN